MKINRLFISFLLLSYSLICVGQANAPLKIFKGAQYFFGVDISEGGVLCSENVVSTASRKTFFYIGYDIASDMITFNINDKTGIIGKYVYDLLEKEMPEEVVHMASKNVTFTFANGKILTCDCGFKAMFIDGHKIDSYDFEFFPYDDETFQKVLLSSNIKTIRIGPKSVSFTNSRTAPTIKKMRTMTDGATVGMCGDNVKYALWPNGFMRIFGTGAMKDYNDSKDTPFFNDLKKIKRILIQNGVTTVGKNAFNDCDELESLGLPNTLITIGDGAFYGCDKLESLELPNTLTTIGDGAFRYCIKLKYVSLPASLVKIEDQGFHATCIEELKIPKNVNFIGKWAFDQMYLKKIVVDPQNQWFDSRDNCNAIIRKSDNTLLYGCGNSTIPSTVEVIGEDTFHWCLGKSPEIPNSVVEIKKGAFFAWEGEKLIIPSSVKIIGEEAFTCAHMKSLVLSNTLVEIQQSAFKDCDNLTYVYIPDSVTKLESFAFSGCDNLKEVSVPRNLEFDEYCFKKYGENKKDKVKIVRR